MPRPFYFILISMMIIPFSKNEASDIQETRNLRGDAILFPKNKKQFAVNQKIRTMESVGSGEEIGFNINNDDSSLTSDQQSDSSARYNTRFQLNPKLEPKTERETIAVTSIPIFNRAPPNFTEKIVQTVEINEETNRLKLGEDEGNGSNLWIYSNITCILLVIALSIFLIYYPTDKDNQWCRNSESSSTSVCSVVVAASAASASSSSAVSSSSSSSSTSTSSSSVA